MIIENAFDFEIVNRLEDDSTSNDTMIATSDQICNTQLLLDTSIEDLKNNKKIIVSTMESVMMLMREVECEENSAEQAKAEAVKSSVDILVKVDERKQAMRQAEEIHNMLVRKVCVQNAGLATKQVVLQHRVESLLDDGDRSLAALHEISRSLEMRLTSALMKKDLAIKKQQQNEVLSQVVLAYEDLRIQKMIEESNRWEQKSLEISKFLKFVTDQENVVDMLQGEMSKENLSMLSLSNPSFRSNKLKGNKNVAFEIDVKVAHGVADITEDGQRKYKQLESQVFDEFVKIKNKRHGNQKFASRIKKVKIKRFHVVLKRYEAENRADSFDDIQESFSILFIIIILYVLNTFHVF